MDFGIERDFASAPTLDTERRILFRSIDWNPSRISVFGHFITVDLPTGNLSIETSDVSYPYYNFNLAIMRRYDVQEQYMQLTYLANYPNVDPKPHLFGNWISGLECDSEEIWHQSLCEMQLNCSQGPNGLFEEVYPSFLMHVNDEVSAKDTLRTYGIASRTLSDLQWNFQKNDLLLRTTRSSFQILSGRLYAETMVDPLNAQLWVFNPARGIGYYVSSDYYYNVQNGGFRDVGFTLLVNTMVDALGHSIKFTPTSKAPPYQEFLLTDGSGRDLRFDLQEERTFLDGLKPGSQVRKYLISGITDDTKNNFNQFSYNYNANHLLTEVDLPSSIGIRKIKYHYDHPTCPGLLTSIENSFGGIIQFEYIEDPFDIDDRLNPRLKISKITDPEGNIFEYDHDPENMKVNVTLVDNKGNVDRVVNYTYQRDEFNTKRRYITKVETNVTRGYSVDNKGNLIAIAAGAPQVITNQTVYTNDGRFNIAKKIDSLDREQTYEYNDFNQVTQITDFDGHETKYTYDIPVKPPPSPTNPINFDMIKISKDNNIRSVSKTNPLTFTKNIVSVDQVFGFQKYDKNNSSDNTDYKFSTHRISTRTDERGYTWKYKYDDVHNFNPLSPTKMTTPLGIVNSNKFDSIGNIIEYTDAEQNTTKLKYNPQGKLLIYTDPNQNTIKMKYYPCDNWLNTFSDQLSNTTILTRDSEGKIIHVMDPVGDTVDYEYYGNERISKIIRHRPALKPGPADPQSLSLIIPYSDLEYDFDYTPLGRPKSFTNPKGLEILFDFDDMGRLYRWYHNIPNPKYTVFTYDEAGQLQYFVDRIGNITSYTYDSLGYVKSITYPDWNDGNKTVKGKSVSYEEYDHLGKPLTVSDSEIPGKTNFVYDEAGNLILRQEPNGFQLCFTYDKDNRLTDVQDTDGNYAISYQLDDLGRPSTLSDSNAMDGSLSWNYKYSKKVGTKTKVLHLYERILQDLSLETDFDYDDRYQISSLVQQFAGNEIFSENYTYRDDGLLDMIQAADQENFYYDGIKQLVFDGNTDFLSDYDEANNRKFSAQINGAVTPTPNMYDRLNRLAKDQSSNTTFTYDDDGNISLIGTAQFFFDGTGRLRSVSTAKYSVSYIYDFEGNLVNRTIKRGSGSKSKTKIEFFYYAMGKPVMVEDNKSLQMIITWDVDASLLRVRSTDINTGGTNYVNSLFPIQDRFRSINGLIDSSGNIVSNMSYDAWGSLINVTGQNQIKFWSWKGFFTDPDTGLQNIGVRWYNTQIGRWISEDPITSTGRNPLRYVPDFTNLYCYVGNNPVNRIDPTGLDGISFEDSWNNTLDEMTQHASSYATDSTSNPISPPTLDENILFPTTPPLDFTKNFIGPVSSYSRSFEEARENYVNYFEDLQSLTGTPLSGLVYVGGIALGFDPGMLHLALKIWEPFGGILENWGEDIAKETMGSTDLK
ncbi:RHS repeat domain-containing protein [Candidatus Nitrosotalea sp. FS]|uniref:RHS repeat domain-containing protein n=1 Tax=Candidatus Nitrosotalea sp. FS TaxID=2341021 RepID=UPI00140918DA|nr:RHS repeat-associated core domain-containing protein [Candidatus Nitrosotalea sp. FS]